MQCLNNVSVLTYQIIILKYQSQKQGSIFKHCELKNMQKI